MDRRQAERIVLERLIRTILEFCREKWQKKEDIINKCKEFQDYIDVYNICYVGTKKDVDWWIKKATDDEYLEVNNDMYKSTGLGLQALLENMIDDGYTDVQDLFKESN